MEENPAVIIDNGTTVIRGGFAGDDAPRSVISTALPKRPVSSDHRSFKRYEEYTKEEFDNLDDWTKEMVIKSRGYISLRTPIEHGQIVNWDDMEKQWHNLFYNELRVAPEDQPLLITEALGCGKASREKMANVMFETFGVPSMVLANQSLLALLGSGREDGLIVEAGGGTTSIIPVSNTTIIGDNTNSLNIDGEMLTDYCIKLLTERGVEMPSDTNAARDIARNIKEKHGYVALNFNEEKTKQIQHPTYEFDGKTIALGDELFRTPEPYFNPELLGLESVGLSKLVVDSINKCDPGLHAKLYGNILLSGGSSLFTNLGERLRLEITELVPDEMRSKIKVIETKPSSYRLNSAWIGGSIVASVEMFKKYQLSKAEYDEVGPDAAHSKIGLSL